MSSKQPEYYEPSENNSISIKYEVSKKGLQTLNAKNIPAINLVFKSLRWWWGRASMPLTTTTKITTTKEKHGIKDHRVNEF